MMKIENTRPKEFHEVCSWFNGNMDLGNVDIYGISGYGGIGKSFLLRHVIEHEKPSRNGYLTITLDGSNSSILGNFMGIYDSILAPRAISEGKRNTDYFPRTRELSVKYNKLHQSVINEIDHSNSSDVIKKAAEVIFQGGSTLNKLIPITKDFIDVEMLKKLGIEKGIDQAIDLLDDVKSLSNSNWLPGPIEDLIGLTYEKRMKSDLYKLAAGEWVADLSAILDKYRSSDYWHFTHSRIDGIDKLLLIIDDFEILGKSIAHFIINALIPDLEKSNFHTTIIFVGRDDLYDANVSFQHHLSHLVKKRIRLDKFSEQISKQLFSDAGHPASDLDQLYDESHGYPFLVGLLCEVKGGNVSFYNQFYERTTRWITPTERDWVLPLCYLDEITESSVEVMMPDAPASAVLNWFKHEASLRDPNAKSYVIAPYIRRTLKEYHRLEIGTRKYEIMLSLGIEASAIA